MPRTIDEEALRSAVLKLWVREGYAGTTTKRAAEDAGVNEATLFRRYGDKAKLVCWALTEALTRVPLRVLEPTGELRVDLLAITAAYAQTQRRVGDVFPLLLVEAARHPELRPALAVAWENLGAVAAILAHHQAAGALREEPPMQAANALLGPLFAQGLARRAAPRRVAAIDVEAHVEAFLHGRAPGAS